MPVYISANFALYQLEFTNRFTKLLTLVDVGTTISIQAFMIPAGRQDSTTRRNLSRSSALYAVVEAT